MTYLLDTNAASDLMRGAPSFDAWMTSRPEQDRVILCAIVRGEILFGIARMAPGKRRAEVEDGATHLLSTVPCEPVPAEAGDHYSRIKLARQRSGLTLDENDLWIAATAILLRATLVTRDADFAGIEGLSVLSLHSPNL